MNIICKYYCINITVQLSIFEFEFMPQQLDTEVSLMVGPENLV